jgi:hypothetical protein
MPPPAATAATQVLTSFAPAPAWASAVSTSRMSVATSHLDIASNTSPSHFGRIFARVDHSLGNDPSAFVVVELVGVDFQARR